MNTSASNSHSIPAADFPAQSGLPSAAPGGPGAARVWTGKRSHETIATVARLLFIVLGCIAFAYLARMVVLPVLFAWVAAMMLKAPVRWLVRCRFPTALAAGVVLGVFVTGISFAVLHLGRPALAWAASVPENLPRLQQKFQHLLLPAARFSAAASSVGSLVPGSAETPVATPVEVKDHSVATSVFSWTSSLLASIGETLVLVFLLLAAGDTFMQKLLHIMPRLRDKKQAVEICREIQHSISNYLFSVGLVNLALGIAVGGALHLAGMPNALMWGAVAACVNFIPYFGPVLGVLAVGVGGLLAFDTIGRGLLPAGIYFVLHFVEANFITPHVLGRRFTLNPVLIFVALIFGLWLWGAAGALLAAPLLVTAKVICDRVSALQVLGNFLAPHQSREEEAEVRADVRPPALEQAAMETTTKFP
jgi:predicted PurR-regulated permease PerM